MKTQKRVHYFGKTKSEGTRELKELLGGKGANLAEMTSIGLPVPPGFTITTETCAAQFVILGTAFGGDGEMVRWCYRRVRRGCTGNGGVRSRTISGLVKSRRA